MLHLLDNLPQGCCGGIGGAEVESGSGRSKIAPTVRNGSAVTPHPTSLTLGHLPLKGKALGRAVRADVGIGPYGEERSAFVIVGATCVSPVAEGEMRIDDRWSKLLGFLSLSQKSEIFDSRLRAARSRL